MRYLVSLLSFAFLSAIDLEPYLIDSIWSEEAAREILEFTKTICTPRSILEIGMDLRCVKVCSEVFDKILQLQTFGMKKVSYEFRKQFNKKVGFARGDSRFLHVGDKPMYGLIIINGNHKHRIMDLAFAFKHTRNFIVTCCDKEHVDARKALDFFLAKNRHVKIVKQWSYCGGTMLLKQ